MKIESTILAPVALDMFDSSGRLYGDTSPTPRLEYGVPIPPTGATVLDTARELIQLKQVFDAAPSAIDLATSDPSIGQLRPDRAHALAIANELAGLLSHNNTQKSLYYGFADVAGLGEHDPEQIYRATFLGRTVLVRAEETLAAHAEAIASGAQTAASDGKFGARFEDNTLVRQTAENGEARIKLHGYTFNRGAAEQSQRREYPNFPSCETFIAAAALEQAALADRAIRIIPFSMKDREYSARYLLQLLGITNLPVLSVAISGTGDIQKLISWSQNPDLFQDVREMAKGMGAHDQSNRLAKVIHDRLFQEHRQLHDQRDDLPIGVVAPSKLMTMKIGLEERLHLFFAHQHRAAPIHEEHRIRSEDMQSFIATLAGARSHFHARHNEAHGPLIDHAAEVEYLPGRGSNSVSYTKAILATANTSSDDQYHLVAHLVHEGVTTPLIERLRAASSNSVQFLEALIDYPPRYLMLEAKRA